ncbi:hypothetical protein H0X09_01205 [Candidatus Saccharibacteria bacterium]|nr:hypothetical protein [Candidatus Saccharibacteria bacterium]
MPETVGSIADRVARAYAEGKPSEARHHRSVLEKFSSKLTPKNVQTVIVKALFRLIEKRVHSCDKPQLERLVNVLRNNLHGNRADKKTARIIARQIIRCYRSGQHSKADKLKALAFGIIDKDVIDEVFKLANVNHAEFVGTSYSIKYSSMYLVYAS